MMTSSMWPFSQTSRCLPLSSAATAAVHTALRVACGAGEARVRQPCGQVWRVGDVRPGPLQGNQEAGLQVHPARSMHQRV